MIYIHVSDKPLSPGTLYLPDSCHQSTVSYLYTPHYRSIIAAATADTEYEGTSECQTRA